MDDVASILAQPRWAALSRFVTRWYAEPLGLDPTPVAEIEEAEARLGVAFPRVVREWYALVGRRLRFVNQDRAVVLADQEVRDGRLVLWWENQGVWRVEVALGAAEEDPFARVVGYTPGSAQSATVSEALLGMVASDTLVGAWATRLWGPLGRLAEGVVGGYVDRASPGFDGRLDGLPHLDVWPNPFFADRPLGHETLFVRDSDVSCEWMAATPEAEAEVAALLGFANSTEPEADQLVPSD